MKYERLTEEWKKYALFIKEHLKENNLSIAEVSLTARMHRNTLGKFLKLETCLKFDAFIALVEALDLKIVFKPKIEGEILQVYDAEDFDGQKEDLGPPILETLEVLKIGNSEISVLTNGETYFYPLLDLCDLVNRNYVRELQKINRDEDFSKDLFMARIREGVTLVRDVYVFPEKKLLTWFLNLSANTVKQRNQVIKYYGELKYRIGRI